MISSLRVFIPAEPQPEFWAPSVVLHMDLKYSKPSSSPFSIPNKIMKADSVFVFSRGWNPSEFLQTGFRELLDAQCQAAAWEVPWDDLTAPCWNCVPSFPVPPEGTHSHRYRCTRMGFIPRELHLLPASWILSHFLGMIFHDFTISGRVWSRTQTPLTVTDNPKDPWILYFTFLLF